MEDKRFLKYVILIQEYNIKTNEKYKYDSEINLVCNSLEEAKKQFEEQEQRYYEESKKYDGHLESYVSFTLYEVVSSYNPIKTKILK
jgi:hypothetical protein